MRPRMVRIPEVFHELALETREANMRLIHPHQRRAVEALRPNDGADWCVDGTGWANRGLNSAKDGQKIQVQVEKRLLSRKPPLPPHELQTISSTHLAVLYCDIITNK